MPAGAAPPSRELPDIALAVIDHIPAMVAYWDRNQICRFANEAYRQWFGRSRSDLLGTSLEQLLGPIYPLNLPYIKAVLAGETQVFEREIPDPAGKGVRHSLATYTPDIVGGVVVGFFVHVADSTLLRNREMELARVIAERDLALAEIRTLRGLLCVCSSCHRIRDEHGEWERFERFVTDRTHARFSHGICPDCAERLYPDHTK